MWRVSLSMGRYLQSYTKPCIAFVIAATKMRNQFVFMRYHVNGCVRVNVRTLTVFLFQRFFCVCVSFESIHFWIPNSCRVIDRKCVCTMKPLNWFPEKVRDFAAVSHCVACSCLAFYNRIVRNGKKLKRLKIVYGCPKPPYNKHTFNRIKWNCRSDK